MKAYEGVSRHSLVSRTPVIVRVDGRAFHTLTGRICSSTEPFDREFDRAMWQAAFQVALGMQGFKVGYIQSDEASFLLTDFDDVNTQPWFGNNLSKIVSISAATMSVSFAAEIFSDVQSIALYFPVFDARAFNVPKEDVSNYFLWRAKDWHRNSIFMYARKFFSHKELFKKRQNDVHEMLRKIGKNWATDLTPDERNGSFLFKNEEGKIRGTSDIRPNYYEINSLVEPYLKGEK